MKLRIILSALPLVALIFLSCTSFPPPPLIEVEYEEDETAAEEYESTNEIPFYVENGVRVVKVQVNGVEMEMIFDTGASGVSLSLTEAQFLYKQGRLTDDDILGLAQMGTADGSISVGTVINLRELELADGLVAKNVEAVVVNNHQAPLLLGNSALRQFGSFTIDDARGVIIFND